MNKTNTAGKIDWINDYDFIDSEDYETMDEIKPSFKETVCGCFVKAWIANGTTILSIEDEPRKYNFAMTEEQFVELCKLHKHNMMDS